MRNYLYSLIFAFLLLACQTGGNDQHRVELEWVNLCHLNSLYEEVKINGEKMAIIHIYSEYPDYGWVDASNEGIACVDDVARAAVVYLRHFEITGDSASLNHARNLLEFCRHMQAEDGLFYNFIYSDYSINHEGKTSFKSLGWWAARGLWALGEGYRVFLDQDADYAHLLEKQIKRIFPHIDTLLSRYPEVESQSGFLRPQWLLYNSAADATSELMLGLAAYAEASHDTVAIRYLQEFGEGLVKMQISAGDGFPMGAHLSWRNAWHAWGNSQTQALARAGRLTKDVRFIESAELACTQFYPDWIEQGFPREMTLAHDDTLSIDEIKQFDQIAYGMRPSIVGSLVLSEVTGDGRFAGLAAELATWFFGNNPAQTQMYDPQTGRCFDGILSETEINRNSGAESTIEALYAILEIEANPEAKKKLLRYLD